MLDDRLAVLGRQVSIDPHHTCRCDKVKARRVHNRQEVVGKMGRCKKTDRFVSTYSL